MLAEQMSLSGKVGIVTGAGQGLGKVYALAYAEAGADVVVAEVNEETGKQTASELEGMGRRAAFVPTDVRNAADCRRMVAFTVENFGRVDFLMNNAGITKWCPAEDVTGADWREVMEVNVNGVWFCAQAAGRQMIAQGDGGAIVNIASMSAQIVNRPQCQAAYNTSKAAVEHLTRSLAAEWAPHGIRVNAISPGYMGTAMAKPFFDDPEYGGVWIPNIPMGRPGEPEELAVLAVFLVAPASSYMTGSVVTVDGGYTCW